MPIRPKYTIMLFYVILCCIPVHSAISQDTLTSIPRYWPIRMNIFPISRFHNPQIYHKMQCIWLHLGAFYNIPRHLAWSPQYGPTPWGPGLAHIFFVFVFRFWYRSIRECQFLSSRFNQGNCWVPFLWSFWEWGLRFKILCQCTVLEHKSFTPETTQGTFTKRRTRGKMEGDDNDNLQSVKCQRIFLPTKVHRF